MLEFVDMAFAVFTGAHTWFLAAPLPIRVVVGAVALAVLWVLWTVLRVTLVAFRAAFRGL